MSSRPSSGTTWSGPWAQTDEGGAAFATVIAEARNLEHPVRVTISASNAERSLSCLTLETI